MSARTCPRGLLTKVVRYSLNTLPTSAAYFSSFWNGMTSPRLGCGTVHGLAYRISPRRTISYAGGVFTAERPAPKPRRAVPKEQRAPNASPKLLPEGMQRAWGQTEFQVNLKLGLTPYQYGMSRFDGPAVTVSA